MIRVLLATQNRGKIREFANALIPAGVEVVGLDSLADAEPVEETGATFEENALLKAESYSRRTDLPVLADDSGIEVDALDGRPGVHSARYGGTEINDVGRNSKLIEELRGVAPDRRTGRFRCVLAVALGGNKLATFDGVVEGRILDEPRGDQGFGYDPVFLHTETGRCFGELPMGEKERYSHRGQAIRAFLDALRSGDPRLVDLGRENG